MRSAVAWSRLEGSRREAENGLYDHACELVDAARAIARAAREPDAVTVLPPVLGCLEAVFRGPANGRCPARRGRPPRSGRGLAGTGERAPRPTRLQQPQRRAPRRPRRGGRGPCPRCPLASRAVARKPEARGLFARDAVRGPIGGRPVASQDRVVTELSNSKTFDVAVIGGGVIGTMAALELAEQGASVVVLERGAELAWGCSAATPGSSDRATCFRWRRPRPCGTACAGCSGPTARFQCAHVLG